METHNKIGNLIKKYREIGLNEQEQKELDEWIELSETNKKLFEQLTNESFVETLKEIDARAERKERQRGNRMYYFAVAIAVLLIAIAVLLYYSSTGIKSERVSIPVDSTLLINQILEKDSQKQMDTAKVIYEFNNGREFIKGEIIRRGKRSVEGDTLKLKRDDSNNYFITVPNEVRLRLTFSDKTKVWLNAGTSITLSGNSTSNRNFKIDGEACFEISENKVPLTIETQGGNKFVLRKGNININTFGDSINYYASLNGGEALIHCGDGREQIKLAGNKCITFGTNKLLQREKCDPTIACMWTKGFFVEDTTLTYKHYFESIGRWYDIDITFPKSPLPTSFAGKIPMQESLKSVLELFKYNGVKFKFKLIENGEKLNLVLL